MVYGPHQNPGGKAALPKLVSPAIAQSSSSSPRNSAIRRPGALGERRNEAREAGGVSSSSKSSSSMSMCRKVFLTLSSSENWFIAATGSSIRGSSGRTGDATTWLWIGLSMQAMLLLLEVPFHSVQSVLCWLVVSHAYSSCTRGYSTKEYPGYQGYITPSMPSAMKYHPSHASHPSSVYQATGFSSDWILVFCSLFLTEGCGRNSCSPCANLQYCPSRHHCACK
mmetsp:Transcript_11810/g.27862  ORF Transcript_11810/g.27862 Transcript_11810/m.27862 type:complete len:224 (+) Transcript_11810:259-930(+)